MNGAIYRIYQNFKIFFTFFLIWTSIQFGVLVEDFIGYVLVLSIGILHGANDLLILSVKEKTGNIELKNLMMYVAIVFFCVLLYVLFPFISILIFILMSSFHFGEEHFSHRLQTDDWFRNMYFISYGLLLFSILFYVSFAEVKVIMVELSGVTFSEIQIISMLVFSLFSFCLLHLFLLRKKKISFSEFFKELFYLAVLFLVFKTTTLIFGFAVYFILWHSIPSILHQITFISGDFSKKNLMFYLKKAFPFWLISIVGLMLLYQFFNGSKLLDSIVFVILFAVTAPHIWVMYRMKT